MFDVFRQQPKRALLLTLPALMAAVYLILVVRYTYVKNDGYVGALLDDTWIHVRFAESIANGEGLSYNAGEITPGATSPLWVLILGGIYAVTEPSITAQVHIAIGMSAVGNVLTVLAVTGFGWWASRRAWIGLLAGMITALTGRYIWMGLSGMETTLFAALCVFALWSHVHDVRVRRAFGWRTGIITGLATLARPDGYLLAALIGLDAFVWVPLRDGLTNGAAFWQRVRHGWRGIVAYGLLGGVYPLASLIMTGCPLPNTFRVKSQLGKEFPDLPFAYFWQPRVDHGWLLLILAGIGIGFLLWRDWTRRDRTGLAWAVWPTGFALAMLFLGAQHYVINHGRYVAPAIPFHALAAAIGVGAVAEISHQYITQNAAHLRRVVLPSVVSALVIGITFGFDKEQWDHVSLETLQRVVVGSAGIGLIVVTIVLGRVRRWVHCSSVVLAATLGILLIETALGLGSKQGKTVANDVHQLYAMHVTAGHFLRENTEPDQTIALNDIGAMTHVSDRRVLDLMGLVSPEVIDAIKDEERFTCPYDLQLARVMLDDPPALIAIFPWFFPCLSRWEGALQPFQVFTLTGPTTIAGGELIVYWPVWENWPVQRVVAPEATRLDVDFEQGITLAGYETDSVEAGLQVTLWWQAQGRPQGDYTVFAHLIDAEDEIVSQKDSRPQLGQFNTLWWREGDIIRDPRLIPLDDEALLDQDGLALRIGLYPTGDEGRLLRVPAPLDQPDFVIIELDLG